MPQIVAVLFEDRTEDSYIAIRLEGAEPKILFTKGPLFLKTMGPYPVPYSEATFRRWKYSIVENPPEINLKDKKSLADALLHLRKQANNRARYCPETAAST